MRDLLLASLYAVALPLMLWRPAWGALGWAWFGIFNPHRYAWGFATTIPFATTAFVATVIGALFSREPKRLKGGAATAVLIIFTCHTVLTTSVALVPDAAWRGLETTLKVQLGTLLVLTVLYRKDHVLALIWVIAGSIGFYAIKGGIFTLATLGQFRVFGPDASIIADNNAFVTCGLTRTPAATPTRGISASPSTGYAGASTMSHPRSTCQRSATRLWQIVLRAHLLTGIARK